MFKSMKARNVMKALTAALLLSSSAIAQLQISGKVQNDYGEALQGVTVSIKGKKTPELFPNQVVSIPSKI